jgi:hypothetical protein
VDKPSPSFDFSKPSMNFILEVKLRTRTFWRWFVEKIKFFSNGTSISPGGCGMAEKKPQRYDRRETVISQWSDRDTINDLAPAIQRKSC